MADMGILAILATFADAGADQASAFPNGGIIAGQAVANRAVLCSSTNRLDFAAVGEPRAWVSRWKKSSTCWKLDEEQGCAQTRELAIGGHRADARRLESDG